MTKNKATTDCRATFYRIPNELARLAQQWSKEREIIDMLGYSVGSMYLVARLARRGSGLKNEK